MTRKKSDESLEEGLNRSADKRGLSGKERHRYIGGALHNMGKGKTRSGKREPAPARPRTATHTVRTAAKRAETHKAPPAAKKAYSSPTITKRPHVELEAKKRRDHYEIVNVKTGETWNGSRFKKLASARAEAKNEQDAYNGGYKRSRF